MASTRNLSMARGSHAGEKQRASGPVRHLVKDGHPVDNGAEAAGRQVVSQGEVVEQTVDEMLDVLRRSLRRTVQHIGRLDRILDAEEVDVVAKTARALIAIKKTAGNGEGDDGDGEPDPLEVLGGE